MARRCSLSCRSGDCSILMTTNNSFTFTYDITAPVASIATQINAIDNDETPAIQLNITDNVAVADPNWVYIVLSRV